MSYFPFFIELEHKICLIVGGGPVACRKALALSEYGAGIIAVSPCFLPEFYGRHKFQLLERLFRDEDLAGVDVVIAATDDREENRRIAKLCREQSLLVNVANDRGACSFLFPALVRDEGITIGITTGGDSPAVAKLLREKIRSTIPEGLGCFARSAGKIRADLVQSESPEIRRAVFRGLAEHGMKKKKPSDESTQDRKK